MSGSASIVDPFHRAIHDRLSDEIDKRMVAMASGSAVRTESDQVSTAEKYAAQCAYLQAFNDIIDICKQIELERYGPRPGEGEQQQGS